MDHYNEEARISIEEPLPNYKTRKATEDVQAKKGKRVKNAKELFTKLGI